MWSSHVYHEMRGVSRVLFLGAWVRGLARARLESDVRVRAQPPWRIITPLCWRPRNGVATAARMPLSNGTTVALWPKDAVLIGWAKERLGMR